jgi:hypothetical protein
MTAAFFSEEANAEDCLFTPQVAVKDGEENSEV